MDVGVQTLFASAGWDDISDAQVYEEDTSLARLAEEVGFDVVWAVEHHLYDYSFCPDNTQWLAYIAGRTERIDLGTAAIILPWNEPLRVAEKVALLDQLAAGRLRLGFGRGLSRREYALRRMGSSGFLDGFFDATCYGTPRQVIDHSW
jgi:alkanesulfonate monooxygenase SsuD/methylene tetrahydromethanopterin reductase-like flavin-dependent oxidoreductase (luciferase family)